MKQRASYKTYLRAIGRKPVRGTLRTVPGEGDVLLIGTRTIGRVIDGKTCREHRAC